MSYLLFVCVCVLWCSTRIDHMNNMAGVLLQAHEFTPVFDGVRVAHLDFRCPCCVICSVCRRPCVPNVASVSGLVHS